MLVLPLKKYLSEVKRLSPEATSQKHKHSIKNLIQNSSPACRTTLPKITSNEVCWCLDKTDTVITFLFHPHDGDNIFFSLFIIIISIHVNTIAAATLFVSSCAFYGGAAQIGIILHSG